MELPVIIVATVLAVVYGFFISKKWYLALLQGGIMAAAVFLCGRCLPRLSRKIFPGLGVGQTFGVLIGSLIIFLVFGLRAHHRMEKLEKERDQEAESINEEDE